VTSGLAQRTGDVRAKRPFSGATAVWIGPADRLGPEFRQSGARISGAYSQPKTMRRELRMRSML
jgi:hypothetical protein